MTARNAAPRSGRDSRDSRDVLGFHGLGIGARVRPAFPAPGVLPVALLTLVLGLLALCVLVSCESSTKPQSKEELALFGFLYVGEAIGDSNVWISRTLPIDQRYTKAGVTGAIVLLRREDSDRADTLRMTHPGYYGNSDVVIQSGMGYELTVKIGGQIRLTASTRTPAPFTVTRGPRLYPGTMRHAVMADSFPIVLSCLDPEQIFMIDVFCRESWETAKYIYPFGPEDYPQSEEEYGGADGEPRHIYALARIKNLPRMGSSYVIHFYDAMMAFYGQYDVQILSLDENYYNYLYREHPELNGGIEGGIGVFGAADRVRYHVQTTE